MIKSKPVLTRPSRFRYMIAAAGMAACLSFPLSANATDDTMTGFDTPVSATADFVAANGESRGAAILDESKNGVLIRLELEGLPPGEHAIHIHEQGDCAPVEIEGQALDPQNYFANAGSHLNPEGKTHGLMNETGPHSGDLPNIHVGTDGTLKKHIFTDRVTLTGEGEVQNNRAVLLDENGAALVVHEGADDYESDPTGRAGHRIACAEIKAE